MSQFLLPIIAYLFGSISSAVVVSSAMGLPDPRSQGSNNPGATNVLRLGSKPGAALTLLGDVLKGVVPVLLADYLQASTLVLAITGFCAFIGHLFPLFFGFKGGKGVATALGVFLAISLPVTGVLIAIWGLIAALFRYSSLSALTAAACAPIVCYWLLQDVPLTTMCGAIAVTLIWRHSANIKRLMNGTEGKIGQKS
ncbi:MAG: glycerol-3-phosphate acyltransferase PlsY [Parasphingorhabdus sp.]|jgi:glycerol-3-phosphate acyltransferase PlsY